MTDLATPNLPARNLQETEQFYGRLGFSTVFRDDGWMILARADMRLEFFPYPQLDPLTSWFSCCLRLDDLDRFYETCLSSGISESRERAAEVAPARDPRLGWQDGRSCRS